MLDRTEAPPFIAMEESEITRLGSIALDQWRGLALIMVLISHGFFFTNRVNGIGRIGVNLFFFISGILVFRSLSRSKTASSLERSRSSRRCQLPGFMASTTIRNLRWLLAIFGVSRVRCNSTYFPLLFIYWEAGARNAGTSSMDCYCLGRCWAG